MKCIPGTEECDTSVKVAAAEIYVDENSMSCSSNSSEIYHVLA